MWTAPDSARTAAALQVLRAAKVCKEEIFGLVAAVEGFVNQDEPALLARETAEVHAVATRLAAFPGVTTRVEAVSTSSQEATPQAVVTLVAGEWAGPPAAELLAECLDRPQPGDPRVFVRRRRRPRR